MQPYRNIGAAFGRADGTTWGRDQVLVPTPEELGRRGYKLRPVAAADEAPAPAPPTLVLVDSAHPLAAQGWPLRMLPETYLKLHPDGPHAALARTLLAVEQGEEPLVVGDVQDEGDDGHPDE